MINITLKLTDKNSGNLVDDTKLKLKLNSRLKTLFFMPFCDSELCMLVLIMETLQCCLSDCAGSSRQTEFSESVQHKAGVTDGGSWQSASEGLS